MSKENALVESRDPWHCDEPNCWCNRPDYQFCQETHEVIFARIEALTNKINSFIGELRLLRDIIKPQPPEIKNDGNGKKDRNKK